MQSWHDEALKADWLLVTLIEAYERKHFPIGPVDPVEAIKFRMEQQNLTPKDWEPFLGSSGRVSEVLNRKRRLSLQMARNSRRATWIWVVAVRILHKSSQECWQNSWRKL